MRKSANKPEKGMSRLNLHASAPLPEQEVPLHDVRMYMAGDRGVRSRIKLPNYGTKWPPASVNVLSIRQKARALGSTVGPDIGPIPTQWHQTKGKIGMILICV